MLKPTKLVKKNHPTLDVRYCTFESSEMNFTPASLFHENGGQKL